MRLLTLGGLCTAGVLLHAAAATAQPTLLDLRDLKPQQLRSEVFTVATPQDVRVEAVGGEAARDSHLFSWVTAMWRGRDDQAEPWRGDAWILDTHARRVVWQLSTAATARGRQGTRTFSGTVNLPAVTYEAFYASFPPVTWTGDGESGARQRFADWLNNTSFDQYRLTIHGHGQLLSGAEAERARRDLEAGTVIALRGDHPEGTAQRGFVLERPMEIEVYSAGEVREDAEFDAGSIIDADTRQPVWRLSWRDSTPAGGAAKNRMVRMKKTLPAGRYAALYSTDDSHDPAKWNAAPPRDPYAWGLFVRAISAEAATGAVKTFAYEHVPAASVIAAIIKVGDDERASKRFMLDRAADVRIYAIGEGSGDRMFDYGWIENAASGQKVWEMRYGQTEPAGGDGKNRLVDRTVRLEKGDYVLRYVSDDSQSYRNWNAAAPRDAAHWGITVLTVTGNR
jgi:hypothetical protein